MENLSAPLRQDEMLTADAEEGGKASKTEVWHSQVLSLHLMTVNSEEGKIINCVCDRKGKLTSRHHFLEAELTLLFCIFLQVIHEYTHQQPLAFSYHSRVSILIHSVIQFCLVWHQNSPCLVWRGPFFFCLGIYGVSSGGGWGISGWQHHLWKCSWAAPCCSASTGVQCLADQRHLLASGPLAHGPTLLRPWDTPGPHLTIWTDPGKREG